MYTLEWQNPYNINYTNSESLIYNIAGLTLEGDSGKEVALWRSTSLSRWSKAKFKSPCNFEVSPYGYVAARLFSPLVIYEKCWYRVYWNLSYPLRIWKWFSWKVIHYDL